VVLNDATVRHSGNNRWWEVYRTVRPWPVASFIYQRAEPGPWRSSNGRQTEKAAGMKEGISSDRGKVTVELAIIAARRNGM